MLLYLHNDKLIFSYLNLLKVNYLEISFKYSLYLFKLSSGHIFFGSYISLKQTVSSDKFNHGSLSFVNICTWGGNLSGLSKVLVLTVNLLTAES